MILAEIYILICILFLAGKDASSYLLKDLNRPETNLDNKRIQRWHRDGVILNALVILPIVFLRPELFMIIPYTVLLRLAVFDLAFNKWAGLDYSYLGSTAWVDKFFARIFGERGAVKKSLFFLAVLIALNVFL